MADAAVRERVARAALLEITAEGDVGELVAAAEEGDGVVTLAFSARMSGYPGWRWTVSLAEVDDADPTVLEAELLPGDGALVAPEWIPWAQRLEEYRAAQAAAGEPDATLEGDDADDADDEDGDDDFEDLDETDLGDDSVERDGVDEPDLDGPADGASADSAATGAAADAPAADDATADAAADDGAADGGTPDGDAEGDAPAEGAKKRRQRWPRRRKTT